ncbi:MAG: ABC-2 transporter permease [Ruminococcus sp.]|nr:ABC-2 transporter permease [Ruminococcus sp.]
MLGFLYKDLRCNGRWVMIMLFVLVFFNVVTSVMILSGENNGGVPDNKLFMTGFFAGFSLISYLVVGAFALNFVQTDERKKWGCYVTAVPGGIAKQVTAKYCFVALSVLVTFCICSVTNAVIRTVNDKAPDVVGINIMLAAVSLLMRSVELPCITAFGTKIGTQVKGGLMAVIVLAVVIYGLFGDLSWIGSEENFWESIFKYIGDFNLKSFGLKLLAAAVPIYAVSCFISMKLFLQGIDRMEK